MNRFTLILAVLLTLNLAATAQDQIVIRSKNLSKPDTVWVFTPSGNANIAHKNFPVVYLLHGWSGNYKQWNHIIDCQAYADKYQFIIVCPDGLMRGISIVLPLREANMPIFSLTI